jgi:hypothetical protein
MTELICPRCQDDDGPHSALYWCDAYQQFVCEDHWVEGGTPYWGYWGA